MDFNEGARGFPLVTVLCGHSACPQTVWMPLQTQTHVRQVLNQDCGWSHTKGLGWVCPAHSGRRPSGAAK
jgi:hypothetical protein